MIRSTKTTLPLFAVGAASLALVLPACSSGSSTGGTSTPAATSAAPTTAAPTQASGCTAESLLAVLPEGATIVRFDCESVAGKEWAAVEVEPGPTVFFLQQQGSTWDVSTSDEICGTASAGLPPKLLDYCSSTSGSGAETGSASPSTTN